MCHRTPSPCVSTAKSSAVPSGKCARNTPYRPSSTEAGPVNPAAAKCAAAMPACAAHPGCSVFDQVPSAYASRIPEAWLPAIPAAAVIPRSSSPRNHAATIAADTVPSVPVGCCPAAWNAPGPTSPSRQLISIPAAIPSSSRLPVAPVASAIARATATAGALGCITEAACVSSKSSACASVPFTSAASAAVLRPPPTRLAWSPRPNPRAPLRTARASAPPNAACATANVSSNRSLASSRTRAGTSSPCSQTASACVGVIP